MAVLLPTPIQRFHKNGKPLANGKLYSYQASTTVPVALYTDPDGLVPHTNPIILDANGECEIWMRPGSYKLRLTDADDAEIWTVNKVRPADGGGGGIVDEDYILEGYSSRFSEYIGPTEGLLDTLNTIFAFAYLPPVANLSGTGYGTVREKGDPVTALTLSANIVKRSDPIKEVRFYQNPSTLLDTQTSGGAIPNGGNSTYNWTGSFSDTTVFRVEVDDTGATGGPSTVTATATYNFVYPYFVGAGAPGASAATIAAMTKRVILSTPTRAENITASNGQVFYFAYPNSYGALTSITDENGYEVISDWTSSTKTFSALDGSSQTYRVYEFKNPVVANTYNFLFKR